MTKSKAIQILNKQIVKVESRTFYEISWVIQTNSYLSKIFGNNSNQSTYFHDNYWNLDVSLNSDSTQQEIKEAVDEKLKYKIEAAINFLGECIDTIDDIGLYKMPPQGNFISRMPEKWSVAFVLGIISLSFYLGTIVCKIS